MKLKQIPEDFIVEEASTVEFDGGSFSCFLLEKVNYNTLDAIKHIANKLHIPEKRISFAGTKDRNAITKQFISIQDVSPDRVEKIELKDIKLKYVGKRSRPISLGELDTNKFTITIREIDIKPEPINSFINYYGPQRFSTNNVEIGRHIVKGNLKEVQPFIGDIFSIPVRNLKIYVHAYQSMIWNKMVDTCIEKNLNPEKVPIPGFGTELEKDELGQIVKEALKEENLTLRSFINRKIPNLSLEGSMRKTKIDVNDLTISDLEDNDLGSGKKITISFTLPKGCYATVFIDQLFNKNK